MKWRLDDKDMGVLGALLMTYSSEHTVSFDKETISRVFHDLADARRVIAAVEQLRDTVRLDMRECINKFHLNALSLCEARLSKALAAKRESENG